MAVRKIMHSENSEHINGLGNTGSIKNAGPKWTKEQTEAITERGCNLLVAAAAGAGKTAVLVERIIRKITDAKNPVDIDRMLIVTFTNAAATEMRERIAEAISAELDKNPDSESIRRQMSLLGNASITTIHSFCKEVIMKHIRSLDLDPGFRVADETECELMRLEAMTELFEEQYEQEYTDFAELLECYGGNRNDQALQDMVMNLYHFIQSNPWPDKWLEEKTGMLDIQEGGDFSNTPWGKVITENIILELSGVRQILLQALQILNHAEGLEKYIPVFAEDLTNAERLLDISRQCLSGQSPGSWDRLYDCLHGMEFSRLPNAKKDADSEKQEIVKSFRDIVKETINTKLKKKLVNARSAEIIRDLRNLHPIMLCLTRLVREFASLYAEKKKRRALVDFNDLEHLCLQILTETQDGAVKPSRAALEYRDYFDEIMVDEYQDSNMVQEIILCMISRMKDENPNVFMVGDVKQSIYRFRQARPELFMEKYNAWPADRGGVCRKILLYKNFRSRPEIISAVNYIFTQIMSVNAGELDYTEKEALNPGAEFPVITEKDITAGGPVEFHLIQTGDGASGMIDSEAVSCDEISDNESDGDDEEIIDNMQSEARLVGQRILKLIEPDGRGLCLHVYDKGQKAYRPVQFRDIVILLRATKNWSDVFFDELSAMGIPTFADTGTGFFKTVEIQVILSLLQLIDNPLQDIPLLSVLRSPIFAFETNELAELRLADRKAALFDALALTAARHPVMDGSETLRTTAEKAAAFIERFNGWRETAVHMTTDQLIWHLYQDTGYYSMVGAMPQGEQRQANLRILYDRARRFEETSYKGLFNFIRFIDRLRTSRGDMGSAKILGENDNVVRIMSIHKSKGLEFPVVFLSGCGKRFNLMDTNKSVLLHQEMGFGPDVVDYRLRISRPSAAKLAIREKIRVETLSEEMRILYVAMTRAREKLIITGSVRSIEKSAARWLRVASTQDGSLPDIEMLKASGYLDWIGPALIRHRPSEADRPGSSLMEKVSAGSGFSGRIMEDKSQWDITIWNKNDFYHATAAEEQQKEDFSDWFGSLAGEDGPAEFQDEVNRRLQWNYPYPKVNKMPAKVTVTELKRRFEDELLGEASRIPAQIPTLVKKPLFLEGEKGLTAAEKGTVLHFVMQHIELNNDDIEGQIENMVKRDLLTEQQAKSVNTGKIRGFLKSELGRRMLASPVIQREVPFNIEIPCHELYLEMVREEYRNETFLLQGIIDCFFEEPEGLVLLDFKTDFVPSGGAEAICQRYRMQIEYYARALGVLTGKKVKGKYIYLFSTGETLEY